MLAHDRLGARRLGAISARTAVSISPWSCADGAPF
jgi:hypothetical protein